MNTHQRAARFLDRLFPSVPPADQARILAAMEGRSLYPVSSSLGEDGGEAGKTPAAEAPSAEPVSTGLGAPAAAGTYPEGEALSGAASAFASPFGPPAIETVVAFYPSAENAWDLVDERLRTLVNRWAGETS